MKQYTDITFELLDLSNQQIKLDFNVDVVMKGLDEVSKYGSLVGLNYRIVFSLGDISNLDFEKQKQIYKYTNSLNLSFGFTLTCENLCFDYKKSIDEILSISEDVVFEISVNPFLLRDNKTKEKYLESLRYSTLKAPHFHFQIVLTEHIMKEFSPSELLNLLNEVCSSPVFIEFSPNLGLDKSEVDNPFDYAKDFYNFSTRQNGFIQDELDRYSSKGEYKYFAKQTFHIDKQLNVYPVSYSVYNKRVIVSKNKDAIGNLSDSSLSVLLDNKKIKTLNLYNKLELDGSIFKCASCKYRASCEFQGIGLIRKNHKDFENKYGHCYGPIHLIGDENGA